MPQWDGAAQGPWVGTAAASLAAAIPFGMVGLTAGQWLHKVRPDGTSHHLATLGAMIGTSALVVAAAAAWGTPLFVEDRADRVVAVGLGVVATAAWLYGPTVGLGLIVLGATRTLSEAGFVREFSHGTGYICAVVALLGPVSILVGTMYVLSVVGQTIAVIWLCVVPLLARPPAGDQPRSSLSTT